MDAMTKLLKQAVKFIAKIEKITQRTRKEEKLDQVIQVVENIELAGVEGNLAYWAGYLRGCAETSNLTLSEMFEDMDV